MRPRVLHVTEAYGGGVATAIEQYMRFPGAEHRLLAKLRPELHGSEVSDSPSHAFVRATAELVRSWMRHRDEAVDVVHVHSSVAAALARSLPHPSAALVYSPHALADRHERAWVRAVALTVERSLAGRTQAFGAVSEPERVQLTQIARQGSSVVLVPHSIATSDSPLEFAERDNRVVAVGRLSFQKNPESVADLPARMAALIGPATEFLWLGDGDPERRRQLETGGWHVSGWLPRSKVSDLVSRARVMVHPARYEGMPFAVAEALGLGTPVLASDLPALRGLPAVACYTSAEELESQLSRLVGDANEWTRVSGSSQRLVNHEFSESKQFHALEELYLAALVRNTSEN